MQKPRSWTWGDMGWPAPQSIPHELSDNTQKEETVLVDRRGKPIVVRRPRPLGFRPPEEKR